MSAKPIHSSAEAIVYNKIYAAASSNAVSRSVGQIKVDERIRQIVSALSNWSVIA